MALIQFTRNYRDLSTDAGYQFEFFCDRCGNGFQTEFQASATGRITSTLDAASNLFGGFLNSAANAARSVHTAAWEKAHDGAFASAVEEAKPHFHKCKRCGHWVDDDCWNGERGLCKDCAPELEEEFSAAQVQAAVNDAREKAAQVDYVSADRFKQTIVGTCPHCGAKVSGGKFCPECGKPLAAEKHCTNCGAKIKVDAKFCPDCGTKQE
jgi:predicted amidophosphoribosyltransferase